MENKPVKILAINPGVKYIGIAAFQDNDLQDWAIKTIPGKWSMKKMIKIQALISDLLIQYQPDIIALKGLHHSRSSDYLDMVVCEIHEIAWRKGIEVQEYSLENIKRFYSPEKKITKAELMKIVAAEYPDYLFRELDWEMKSVKNAKKEKVGERVKKYHSRMFEAVALGAVCNNHLYN